MAAGSFRQIGPGRLEVREGGGCLSLFGMPFLAAGLLGLAVATGLITLQNRNNVTMTLPAAIVIGIAFTLVGGVLVFGRKWTTFNAADRTALVQYGLLVPMRDKIHYLDGYTAVRVEFVRGDSDTADQYPVTLTGPGRSQLRLFGSTKYAEGRDRAVAIAKLLSLKIEDATTAHPKQMGAAEADLPLHLRARLDHEKRDRVDRPAALRSHITEANGIVTIVIPAARMPAVFFLFFLVPVAVAVLLFEPFSRFFRESNTPDPVSWFFLAFLVFAFGVLPAQAGLRAYLKSRIGRTIITASSSGVRIDERGVLKTRTIASLSADEIIDIDHSVNDPRSIADEIQARRPTMAAPPVGPGTNRVLRIVRWLVGSGGVTIKSRQGLTTFAQGLEDEELRYLHYVVRRALSPQP